MSDSESWRHYSFESAKLGAKVGEWISLVKYYDDNPEKMWGQGGGLVNAEGARVSLDLTKWDSEQLLVQFSYLEHRVYTYNHSPLITPKTRWDIGTPGTWFRFRFENQWKLRQVKKEILRRME